MKKIPIDQLRVGMHLHELCGPWLQHPFWRTRFLLADPADIERLRKSGVQEVWIDPAKGLDVAAEPSSAAASSSEGAPSPQDFLSEPDAVFQPPAPRAPQAEELRRAAEILGKGKETVRALFQQARLGRIGEIENLRELVEEIHDSALRNPSALVSLARLKSAVDYTYSHSLAVCALMIVLARRLGLPKDEIREAGLAGLLHDIGKAEVPAALLNKPGRLDEREKALVRAHTSKGHRLLLEDRGISPIVRDVCLNHHERLDGTGYPGELEGERISCHARMAAVCDVYDAITSKRPYKEGWDPGESIRRMARCSGHFDQTIFHAFVKSLGIYPVGSFVRLESGRLGVVCEQGEESLLTPRVKAIYCARSNGFISPEVIDLSRPGDRIASHANPAEWGIRNLERHWLDFSYSPG